MQIDEILSRFHNVKRTGDRQYIACCPAHDDAKQSLSMEQVTEKYSSTALQGATHGT